MSGKRAAILVISSDLKNCHALRDILNREGWKAICASTVGECEEVFASQNIDLVFCDRGLTDGTYRDILAITNSLGRNIRLVVTSRLADWDEYLEALHDGAFDLIALPCRPTDVLRALLQAQHANQKTAMLVAAA